MIFMRKPVDWMTTLGAILFCLPLLTACEGWAKGKESKFVPVSVQAVNYTGEGVGFVLKDPINADNRAGGETLTPYSAGGTICCFRLPKKWRPGVKLEVIELYWVRMPDQTLPQRQRSHIVELPSYAGGKVGDLWVIRASNGEVSVVSSDLQPDHPKWPGAIKGWPVPSVEYQRKIHDLFIDQAQWMLDADLDSLAELKRDLKRHTEEAWEFSTRWEAEDLKPYAGPHDPAYVEMLRENYSQRIQRARENLKRLKEARP